ncbi:ABC transporter permease [Mesorhizobium sp. M2D.F.Ca.ET.185.01.1.1]|uniref:ABC transporter permease n=1 Tax=unclassified Mesorhizobium TaxID=325217 RepID=UPI000FC9E8D6|nr:MULTISPECIES: ABC transporter permease [unclassified Mesorhizobium]TGP52719.1 ABC transporter permease [bacterium M00.F.Ca.ET.230.01.1.1]TGP81012.1 ABC transporter permease [bacterium M00.F.Ca.ET.227.01.1.1]TGP90795.1 ABC transporter permease [bacterium M00.F.Ca.ET.221.01.1.1]TGP97474.1 ABC transporter permease [bacterium M00.F.Ca.ET.222.01.1.1]TGT73240.1 ABC transporter permease [bacterium M00.F.Ca.ET.159.01.1.1]TGT84097.1 ABC transporter permease [bacterium M00.F.Ca.ET.157.01.1.1]TGU079
MPAQSIWTLLSWGPDGWSDDIASGVVVTIVLALATLPIGLTIGFFVAFAKQHEEPSLRLAANIYTTVFRGLPELVTLFLFFFGMPLLLQYVVRLFNPAATIDVNSFIAGMIVLSLIFSSYASEVFLSAFRAIPKGQYEGGYAIGLSKWQTMRLIILPQLIRIAFPGLENCWLSLLKDTSLVSVVNLAETLRQSGVAARVTKHAFLFYSVAALIFLALAILSSIATGYILQRLGRRAVR